MSLDTPIWRTAAEMITEHGTEAEREAVKLANLMLDRGDRIAQIEWLRIWTAIVLLRGETTGATSPTEIAA